MGGWWSSIRLTPGGTSQRESGLSSEETGPTAPLLLPPAMPAHSADNDLMTHNCGTVNYAAPEVLRLPGEGRAAAYSLSADVHSIGMLLWSIASREPPYGEMRMVAAMRAIRNGQRPKPPDWPCPGGWLELASACWHPDPERRPDIAHVQHMLEHVELHNAPAAARESH